MIGNILGIAFLVAGAGLWYGEHGHITTPVLVAGGACLALGGFLLDSAGVKAFLASIASFVPWKRPDPPEPPTPANG